MTQGRRPYGGRAEGGVGQPQQRAAEDAGHRQEPDGPGRIRPRVSGGTWHSWLLGFGFLASGL